MSFPILLTNTATDVAFSSTAVDSGAVLVTTEPPGVELWSFVATSACRIRQGTAKTVTCVAVASLVDTDFMTITAPVSGTPVTVIYELDVTGNGVTAGRTRVNVSTDTTAAQVATRLRTAILAAQSALTVTDNGDGTLLVVLPAATMTITETVANAGFTITVAAVTASVGAGSSLVAAGERVMIDGSRGPQIGVIRDTADGHASMTKLILVR